MKIKEFLRGPLPDNVLKELEAKFGGPLTRLYVVGFKGLYVNPDGKAEEVLKRYGLLAQGGAVRTCTAGYNVAEDRWIGPPAPAVGRYIDIASSDAIFVGAPRRCKAAGAEPAVVDIIRIDRDFEAPRFVVRRIDGKVQVVDRGSGVILKEFPEKEYNVKAAAKALGVPPGALIEAERWSREGGVPADALKLSMGIAALKAAERGLDVRFMLSGAKGFHILLTLERPVPAEWRPAIVKKLAEWLDIKADPAAFDPARKLRVPWTVHTETGRLAVFVDPETLEPVEFDWPKPIPHTLVKTLVALAAAGSIKPAPRAKPKPQRRVGWVPILEAVAAANPRLKSDCRRRFSALFGCACAVDAVSVEACAERLAAALGMAELPHAYAAAMERAYETCVRRIAEGQKPLFSIKRALTLDAGEGEGKVWYSVKECVSVLPKLRLEPAPPAEEQAPKEEPAPEAETPPAEEAQALPAGQPPAEGGEEDAWRELEQFIQRHRL